jgi:Fungalysin metallopeptidase (M36)
MLKRYIWSVKYLRTMHIYAILFCLGTGMAYAQTEIDIAKSYVATTAKQEKLTTDDINQLLVSSAYRSPTTGWYHVYFNQTYQTIEVYNRLMNVLLVNNKPTYLTHNFISEIGQVAKVGTLSNTLTTRDALQKAVADVGIANINLAQTQVLSTTTLSDGTITRSVYSIPTLSNEKVDVKLYWFPVDGDSQEPNAVNRLVLTWNVRFMAKDGQNSWNIQVDATSGKILQKIDDVIHCNFGSPGHLTAPHNCQADAGYFGLNKKAVTPAKAPQPNQTPAAQAKVTANGYTVFDYPLEAPTFGSRTESVSPYTRFAPTGAGPGATNGWHNDGTTSYTITRGNNVWAQEDANGNDGTGFSPSSATLDFNFPYTFGLNTATGNQSAAITNLFYWNNLIHDVLWKYGFDEPSGNFQNNNQGRGGQGNDYVFADAQDGSGTNNADFSTPVDGGNGRMQMFLWNLSNSYQPDGDFDNGIIAHEYGHGWSIRLTGGPGNSSCLNNAEQGGEGWADYLGLMLTTNWSSLSANVASANIARGIGTYALGQATTGVGIRPYRYSYDMANINSPVTYAKVGDLSFSQPHGIGSIWATMLWDMTWEIILQDNQITNNIYTTPASASAMRGNVAALKLVNEGLRLQVCSPSFVQARDAILQADQALFGGRYRCSIGRAFARRGLGANASTGSSSNDRIVSEQFTPITDPFLSSAMAATVCSGSVFSYTATSATPGVTMSWTRPTVAGISNASTTTTSGIVSETLVNTTTEPILLTYFITVAPASLTCGSGIPVPQRVRVLVNPLPTTLIGTYGICQSTTVPVGEGLTSLTVLTGANSATVTTSSLTYVRPIGDNVTSYTAGPSVYFQSLTFVAPSSGNFTFAATSANTNDGYSDSYFALYQNSFNRTSPATNFLRGDDDSAGGGGSYLSSLTHTLVQGTTYILVVSPYGTGTTGTFTLKITPAVFPVTANWFAASAGGSSLATGPLFNPVGVVGSGITNTNTPGTTTFYVGNANYPVCRKEATFVVLSTSAPAAASTTITQGNSVTLTATGCSQVGSSLKWYLTANDAAITMPISPTVATQYYARCERTAGSRICLSDKSSNITVTVNTLTQFDSATSGNWNSPATWQCNCIPDGSLPVQIINTHIITIPNGVVGQAKGAVRFTGTGKISLQGSAKINMLN